MLPPSINEVAIHNNTIEPTIGITIEEINALTDLLIVSISDEIIADTKGCKTFRFTNFKLLVNVPGIQIWKRK